jgi:hypothetical protein
VEKIKLSMTVNRISKTETEETEKESTEKYTAVLIPRTENNVKSVQLVSSEKFSFNVDDEVTVTIGKSEQKTLKEVK